MMKKIAVILLAASLSFASCEDWLKTRSDLNISVDEQFRDIQGFKDALSGIYANLGTVELYARNLTWGMADMLGQYYTPKDPESGTPFTESGAFLYDFTHPGVRSAVDAIWRKAYNLIANINLMLEYLEKEKNNIPALCYDLVRGEGLALRAMLHFDLLRWFGYGDWPSRSDRDTRLTIPYSRAFSPDLVPQLSYNATFELLAGDIDEAVKLLESSPVRAEWTNEYRAQLKAIGEGMTSLAEMAAGSSGFLIGNARFDYYSARALQARIYMWEGSMQSMQKAADAANDCIGFFRSGGIMVMDDEFLFINMPAWRGEYALQPNPYSPVIDYPGTSEGLLTLHVNDFAAKQGMAFTPNELMFDENAALWLTPQMAENIYQTDIYGNRDIRYTYLLRPQGWSNEYMLPIKAYSSASQQSLSVVNLIKYSEIFYIAAECLIKGSVPDLPAAAALLDEVRLVRGIDTGIEQIMPTMDEGSLMAELRKEYEKEFMCEGQLFLFYKRLGSESVQNYYMSMDDTKYILPLPDDEVIFGNRVN